MVGRAVLQRAGVYFLFGASLCGCVGQPQAQAPLAEILNHPTEAFRLPNGLGVALEQAHDTGVAGVVLLVGVGSADEPSGKAGLAHLSEHLVFRSHSEGHTDLFERLNQYSGMSNGWTKWDSTTYVSYVPTGALEQTLGLVAGVLSDPLAGVDDGDFAAELAIVGNERRLRAEDGTPGQVFGWLASATFPADSTYHEPVVGTAESLSALSISDVRAFVQSGYVPGRATLSVSSSLDLSEQRRLVEQAFGAIEARGIASDAARRLNASAQPRPAEPAQTLPVHDALVANPALWVGWVVPSSLSTKADISRLLVPMIEGAFYGNEKERDANITSVSAFSVPGSQSDLVGLEVTLRSADGAAAALESVLDRMHVELGQSTSWRTTLERYKRYVATEYTYDQESLELRTQNAAESMHYFSDPLRLSRRDRDIRAIEPEAVQAFLGGYLSAERARAIVVRPGTEALELIARERRGAAASPPEVRPVVALREYSNQELSTWIRPLSGSKAFSGTLSNGLEVLIVSQPAATYHTVLLGFAGGEVAGGVPGVSVAEPWSLIRDSWELSLNGLTGRRYHTADATLETVTSTGSDFMLSLGSLMERLEGTLVMWPPREFLTRLESFEREDAQPRSRLDRDIWQALFGDSLYGRRPTAEQVHAVRPPDIYRFRSDVLRPENGLLVMVGNLPGETTFQAVEEVLGGWSRTAKRTPKLAAPPKVTLQPRASLEQDWPRSAKAALSLSCVVEAGSIKQAVTLRALASLLDNRLRDQLRNQLTASYSVAPTVRVLRGGVGLLLFESDVSYDQLVGASAVFDGFASDPRTRIFTDQELANARRRHAAAYNLRHSTTRSLATALFHHLLLGFPLDEFDRMPQHLFDVTTDEVNAMADGCAKHVVIGRLGDLSHMSAILAASRAAVQ